MRDFLLGLLSLVIALAVLAGGGELAIRAYLFGSELMTGRTVMLFAMDEQLGWRAAPDYRFEGELVDAAGQAYPANVSTDERGFRAFGDVAAAHRPKVVFIGDSYTHAEQVSDDRVYFSLLGEQLSLEVFALGVGGYGTLQALMMLDAHFDEIQPDAVVVQLCPNDFINNSFELEFASAANNNHKRRPYLIDGAVEYRLPKSNPGLWEFANRHSRLLYFILTRLDRLRPDAETPVEAQVNAAINAQQYDFPPLARSVAITGQLLARLRQRVPQSVPVLAFSTDASDAFAQLVRENGMEYAAEVPDALAAARGQGTNVLAADRAHWNNAGHGVVAAALAPYLDAMGVAGSAVR